MSQVTKCIKCAAQHLVLAQGFYWTYWTRQRY